METIITCAVYGCANSTATTRDSVVQYYYFPKHPVVAQQWVTACWRADPIDTNTAHICSVHFDSNCYTAEYKMLDYLGSYCKMLKFDAVPTLYLPNPQTPVLVKSIEQTVHTETDSIQNPEIKNIVIYDVQPSEETASVATFDSNSLKEFIDIRSNLETVTDQFKENNSYASPSFQEVDELQVIDHSKYKHLLNFEDIGKLKQENQELRETLKHLENENHKLKMKVAKRAELNKKKIDELKKILQQINIIKQTNMSLTDQKNVLLRVFSESQIKILSGKKKIYWSNDDMAMGYTIRQLSNKRCYLYLSKHLNIPLPALSSLKRWATLKKSEFEKEEQKDEKYEDEDSD